VRANPFEETTVTLLGRTVARQTGESPRTIRSLGFHLQHGPPKDLEPEDLRLVIDCPFCGRAVPYPGRATDGSPALAECLAPRCDVYFDFDPGEVYAARSIDGAGMILVRGRAGSRS
jgi:hypothetical protein